MLISVIVTTYNRPLALERVLQGLSLQTDSDFEVVVGWQRPADERPFGALGKEPEVQAHSCLAGRFGVSPQREPQ